MNIYSFHRRIEAVRVKQPSIPIEIQQKHVEREKERTATAVANQTRLVVLTNAETKREEAKIRALLQKDVALIEAEERREVQQVTLRMLEDVAASELGRAINASNTNASIILERARATAAANKMLYTPEFLRLEEFEAWKRSTKTVVYSGNEPLSFPLSTMLSDRKE